MTYKIEIVEKTWKRLRKFPLKDREKLKSRINDLSKNPRPEDCKKLQGIKVPKLYRIRSGMYRIIYTVKDDVLLVIIVDIGHRKEIYRK